jgi:hypothetical protein
MFGYRAYGIDNNPVAVAISKAKLANVTVETIMEALRYALNHTGNYEVPESEFWQLAFEETTLKQLCKIRAYLLYHYEPADNALRGIILGALHGPKSKQKENNSYLSNQMPRTFSSKPKYSVTYWKKYNLLPNKIDIFSIVRKRAQRFYDEEMPEIESDIIEGDARKLINYQQMIAATHIITSPPYYGMRTYYIDQWLRNWFLGGPDTPVNLLSDQMNHSTPEEFAKNLSAVWRNCAQYTVKNAKMHVRFGSIPSRKTNAEEIFKNSIKLSDNMWRIVTISDAGNSSQGKRQATQMFGNQKSEPINEIDVELEKNA